MGQQVTKEWQAHGQRGGKVRRGKVSNRPEGSSGRSRGARSAQDRVEGIEHPMEGA